MNPGLTLLIRLGLRGALRAYWRRLRTVKGALTALLIAPFVLLVLASQLYVLLWAPAGEVPRRVNVGEVLGDDALARGETIE